MPDQLALLLRVVRLRAGVDQGALARQLGVSQATVSRAERGRGHPAPEQVQVWLRLCRARPGAVAAAAALLEAQSEAGQAQAQAALHAELLALLHGNSPGYDTSVPYFADVAAGIGEVQEQRSAPRRYVQVPAALLARDPGCYALRVVGDSMAPALLAGDIVVVSPAAQPQDGCIVAAYIEPDGDVVKQYCELPGGGVALTPLNPAYPTLILGGAAGREGRIWGRVVLQQREL